jgi:putative membrane protein
VDVRNLGQRMVDDYTKWSNGIHRASARLNIPLPEDLDAKRKARVGKVKALSGPEFDQAYLKEMVHLQNKALTITQYEATNAGVTMFRNWAGKMMPTIQEQLRVAKQCLNPTVVSRK